MREKNHIAQAKRGNVTLQACSLTLSDTSSGTHLLRTRISGGHRVA